MRRKLKWLGGATCILAIGAAILLFSFHRVILQNAGRFMAPEAIQATGIADVVILEGAQFIDRSIMDTGVHLLSSGKARRMVIVLHRISPERRPFAFDEDYSSFVRTELKRIGLKDSAFTILEIPVRNPITLTSARGALEILSRDGVKTAVLLSHGFHLRRSFLVYQYLSMPLDIKIYPLACFNGYTPDNWWNEGNGVRDFLSELVKLMYYMARGYIPLKLSY